MINAKEYLDKIPMFSKQKNTLSDLQIWMREAGIKEQDMKIIHVAGTNGKGSVCAFLTSVLKTAGYRVGTFVSPHLQDIRERFLIDAEMVRADLFDQAFHQILTVSRKMMEKGYIHLTFFEFVFLMSMWIFQKEKTDVVVLETGMGGRLDATNVIGQPLVSVITSVSLDHIRYLGDTVEAIAGEKAGIMKVGSPAVFDGTSRQARKVLVQHALAKDIPYEIVLPQDYRVVEWHEQFIIAAFKMPKDELVIRVPFPAEYQLANALLAIRALQCSGLAVGWADLKTGIEQTGWPGRMEQSRPGVYLDGAHNAGGIKAFVHTVKRFQQQAGVSVILLFAVMNDKEYQKMIQYLCDQIELKHVTILHLSQQRSVCADQLVSLFQQYSSASVSVFETAEQAVRDAIKRKKTNDRVFCTGSLYLIGEVQAVLRRSADD